MALLEGHTLSPFSTQAATDVVRGQVGTAVYEIRHYGDDGSRVEQTTFYDEGSDHQPTRRVTDIITADGMSYTVRTAVENLATSDLTLIEQAVTVSPDAEEGEYPATTQSVTIPAAERRLT